MTVSPNPLFMVPYRVVIGVMIYAPDRLPTIDADSIRKAIVDTLPPGHGVGPVNAMIEGPVMLTEKRD